MSPAPPSRIILRCSISRRCCWLLRRARGLPRSWPGPARKPSSSKVVRPCGKANAVLDAQAVALVRACCAGPAGSAPVFWM